MSAGGGQDGAFSQRVVALLVGVGLLAFAAAALVGIYADPASEQTAGANGFSYSAIGNRAWVEILKKLDVPVVLSRSHSAEKAWQDDGLLVLAQPRANGDALDVLEQMTNTNRVLVVLPKWAGFSGFGDRHWIQAQVPLKESTVEEVLAAIDEKASLLRPEGTQGWRSHDWDITPTLADPQLIKSDRITPIVYSDAGVLLGEYRRGSTTIWLLSDPDIIDNSGIDEGDNAAFAVAMVSGLLPNGGAAIFDETIHGLAISPDLWKALLSFPLNLAVLVSLVAVAVLIWAAAGRFGAPLPPRPRLQAGKQVLIANTASLFEFAGTFADILYRYRETCLRDLRRHLHVPRDIEGAALRHWLDEVGEARGTGERYSAVNAEIAAILDAKGGKLPAVLRAAARLHRWKQEMIHGHRTDPDGLRPGPGAGAQDRDRSGRRA